MSRSQHSYLIPVKGPPLSRSISNAGILLFHSVSYSSERTHGDGGLLLSLCVTALLHLVPSVSHSLCRSIKLYQPVRKNCTTTAHLLFRRDLCLYLVPFCAPSSSVPLDPTLDVAVGTLWPLMLFALFTVDLGPMLLIPHRSSIMLTVAIPPHLSLYSTPLIPSLMIFHPVHVPDLSALSTGQQNRQ